ncbi:hypothetical protein MOQ72_03330 [Saccharopolyspora sp. K220]|uniref:hypothetical protein n=1 Tax=Saccharopolyspora soli TaxID=2926618 RepID=UPI001F569620|nr:hypothetical protein [Saccharopolyspora soli]MCI2416444.1 hypothetical protein [Saccharopolyspora soli]
MRATVLHGNLPMPPLHRLALGGFVALVYAVVVGGCALLFGAGQSLIVPAFVAAALCVAGFAVADRRVKQLPPAPPADFAAVAGKLPAVGSWEQSLPVLTRMLADSTDATHASLWLTAGGRLVSAAAWPSALPGTAHVVTDAAALREVPGVRHVVPIMDGHIHRGALAIGKSGAVTEADDRRMQDIANGTALLLRSVALANELRARVRRAEELGAELTASQQRLLHARDVERRRLVGEITAVTDDGLGAIRSELTELKTVLADDPTTADAVLTQLRSTLETVIERFRAVVRGVYPGVLRDEGPLAALRELCADLARPVRVTGELTHRVDWEIESGVYYLAASAIRLLGSTDEENPVLVHLAQEAGQITARIEAPAPAEPLDLQAALADDEDRIAALGGEVQWTQLADRVAVTGWLPDQLAPMVEEAPPEPTEAEADDTASLPVRIHRLAQRYQEVADIRQANIPITKDVRRAREVLGALDIAVRELPADDPRRAELVFELEQIRSNAHELFELELIERLHSNNVSLSDADRSRAARLLGAAGRDPCTRLALPVGTAAPELHRVAVEQLTRWRDRAENPLAPREVREICRGVARTCEGLLHVIAG